MEGRGEPTAEAVPGVTAFGEPEPILLDLLEGVPRLDEPGVQVGVGVVPQEPQVLQDELVERLVGRVVAVEEQERVDEQRHVGHDRDVEGPILLELLGVDSEVV